MTTAEQILHSALALGSVERAEIAHQLLLSLDSEPDEQQVDQAWAIEVQQRLNAIRREEVQLSDWDDAYERIRGTLRQAAGD